MKSIKGTQTEKNLISSFAGESQAIQRYTFWSKQALKDGYQQIAAIFQETALNEHAHAKLFFKQLEGGELAVGGTYPAGIIGSTLHNLEEAANGEHFENATLYPGFAKVAAEEGFPELAQLWTDVAVAEGWHEERYRGFHADLQAGRIFRRDEPVVWTCRNCGFLVKGTEAPAVCPCCKHPQAYFEIVHHLWR